MGVTVLHAWVTVGRDGELDAGSGGGVGVLVDGGGHLLEDLVDGGEIVLRTEIGER